MSEIPNIPEGKKVIERTTASGNKEYVVRNDPNYGGPDCWIATAYYRDAMHPDVVTLRMWRDDHLYGARRQRFARRFVRCLSLLYVGVGRTRFGASWAESLRRSTGGTRIRRALSGTIIRCFLALARTRPAHQTVVALDLTRRLLPSDGGRAMNGIMQHLSSGRRA